MDNFTIGTDKVWNVLFFRCKMNGTAILAKYKLLL